MTTIKGFIARHPAPTYFALTFALSWGGVLMIIGGSGGFKGTSAQTDPLFPFVYLAMLVGPSVTGLMLTALVHGRTGLREFRSRLVNWRVDVRWYAVALLTAPLAVTTVLLALSLFSPQFRPGLFTTNDRATLLMFGLVVGLGAGFFEELGWTGFAVPELRMRYGVLTTALIVGLLWGTWHFLVVIWGIGGASGAVPLAVFVPLDLLSFLPAFRTLMVRVYERTGSLLVAMLMHASLTASMLILGPQGISGAPLLSYEVAFAAALWVIAAAAASSNRRELSRRPLERRVA